MSGSLLWSPVFWFRLGLVWAWVAGPPYTPGQGRPGTRPLVLSGSDVGGEPSSLQDWFYKQFSKYKKEVQTPGRGCTLSMPFISLSKWLSKMQTRTHDEDSKTWQEAIRLPLSPYWPAGRFHGAEPGSLWGSAPCSATSTKCVFSQIHILEARGGGEELGGEQVSSCFHCALSSGWTNFQNHVNARLFSWPQSHLPLYLTPRGAGTDAELPQFTLHRSPAQGLC